MNESLNEIICPKCGNVQAEKCKYCQKCLHEIDKPYFEEKTNTLLIIKGIAIWTIITLLVLLINVSISVLGKMDMNNEELGIGLMVMIVVFLIPSTGLFLLIKSIDLSKIKINKLSKIGFGLSITSLWIWISIYFFDVIMIADSKGSTLWIMFFYILFKAILTFGLAIAGGIISIIALSKIKKSKGGGRVYSISALIISLVLLILFIYGFFNK